MNFKNVKSYLSRFTSDNRYGLYKYLYRYCTPFILLCRENDISIPQIAIYLKNKLRDNNITTSDLFKFCREELKLQSLQEKRNARRSRKKNN